MRVGYSGCASSPGAPERCSGASPGVSASSASPCSSTTWTTSASSTRTTFAYWSSSHDCRRPPVKVGFQWLCELAGSAGALLRYSARFRSIERIAMLKYDVDDIRLFYENDLRF